MTHLKVTVDYFTCQNHHLRDNNQPYNHAVKLPDGGFAVIRFFIYFAVSGSVPRSGNKQSAHFRCRAGGHGEGEGHNI
ncbi:hypothetical protein CDD79_13995 [Raoultella ornithinolytica]|nr:hypothetical protein CDD79_13995 [Raoultella ornithinolytica]